MRPHFRRFGLFFALLLTQQAFGKSDPELSWMTLESSNFRVHAPPPAELFARKMMQHLEEAYALLKKDLQWEMRTKLEVVVRTDVDYANGLAGVFPLNRLTVHAVPFGAFSSIAEYDDWVRTLAVHELTHILANDTTRGIFNVGRAIFGSVSKVNSFQPSWIMEGLAVYNETRFGRSGRGRSALASMMLRTAVLEGLLDNDESDFGITLDRLNDGAPIWFGGHTPYLLGYLMQEGVARAGKSPAAPGKVSVKNSGYFPFFLNSVVSSQVGKDYYAIWDELVADLKKRAQSELAQIRREPATPLQMLTETGRMSAAPALSSDGKSLYYLRDSYSSAFGITRVGTEPGSQPQNITLWTRPPGTSLRFVPHKPEGGLLYSRLDLFREFSLYSDVYYFDLKTRKEVAITQGARASDPDFGPGVTFDEKGLKSGSVVYVKTLFDGRQALVLWNGKIERTLYEAQDFSRLSHPSWGRGTAQSWIVVSRKPPDQAERLLLVSTQTGKYFETQSVGSVMSHATFEGNGAVLFTSNLGGVLNLHRLRFSGGQPSMGAGIAVERLSHVETGTAFGIPGTRAGEYFVMGYSGRGFDLARLRDLKPRPPLTSVLPSLREQWAGATAARADAPPPRVQTGPVSREEYSIWPAILPKYWLPFGQLVTDGFQAGVYTSGSDAIDRHSYGILGMYDSRANFPVYSVLYRYDGLYPSITLSRTQENRYYSLARSANQITTNTLLITYPMGNWEVGFGATYVGSRLGIASSNQGGIHARATRSNRTILPNAIERTGGDSGYRLDLMATGYFIGSNQFASLEGRYEHRIRGLWPRHFVRFLASGGYADNASLSSLYFLGGGEPAITLSSSYLVRGYPSGTLFGRKLVTGNLEYWLPINEIFAGQGTLPIYQERSKVRLFVDVGAGEYLWGRRAPFRTWIPGAGIQYLHDIKAFYHFPLTLAVGFNYGFYEKYGGEKQLSFGLIGQFLPL